MPMTCSRCGGAFAETEVNERFQGVCPRCLAQAALATATPSLDAPPAEPALLAAGQVFQGLEIVEVLGAGGMGVVYKARQPHLDRFVALKVLPARLAEDPQFTERFRREAKALAALSHANIVGVYDFGTAEGVSFLVMEYVDGTNLRGALAGKKLTPEQAMAIVPQLCDALQYAHEEGVVHRDIKPENILIDKRGRVKIADFGLAKIVGGEMTRLSPITRTGYVLGTPKYMAPEQLEEPEKVDHRADIYSMGVVFYEMLTGEVPLGAFVPPSKKVEVDVRLDEVVLKALAREPERRYQHASEVKEDVSQVSRAAAPKAPAAAAPPPPEVSFLKKPVRLGDTVRGLCVLGGLVGLVALVEHLGIHSYTPVTFPLALCVCYWGVWPRQLKWKGSFDATLALVGVCAALFFGFWLFLHAKGSFIPPKPVEAFTTLAVLLSLASFGLKSRRANLAGISLIATMFLSLAVVFVTLDGGAEMWTRWREGTEPPRVAEAPAWFERIVMSDDDLPGLCEFDSPGRGLAAGPLRATTPDDVNLILESLQKAGVGWKTVPSLRRAFLVFMKPGKMGYAALLADTEEQARSFLAGVTPPSGLEGWTKQDGAAAVVAFGPGDSVSDKAARGQMVNWLSDRMGQRAPCAPPGAASARVREQDLPAPCSIAQDLTRPDDPEFATAIAMAGLALQPRDVSALSFQRIEPFKVSLFSMNIPRATARKTLLPSLPLVNGRVATSATLGSLVVVEAGSGWECSPQDYDEVWRLATFELLTGTTRDEDLRRRLSSAAATEFGNGVSIVSDADSGEERLRWDHSLTAVVLAGLAPEDVVWETGAKKMDLLLELKKVGIHGSVSVLSPCFLKSIGEDDLEVVIPGFVHFRVEYGTCRGSIAEFRLPRSGIRFVGAAETALQVAGAEGETRYHAQGLRDGIVSIARFGGAKYVLSPEVWGPAGANGDVLEGSSSEPWQQVLDSHLRNSKACFWQMEGGVLCFASRARAARRGAAPVGSPLLPSDPAAAHVTIDVESGDFQKTALRAAAAGGAALTFSSDVKGRVTARLIDLPWNDALEALVATCGYALSHTASGGLLVSKAPELPPTPLEALFFHEEDAPVGRGFFNPGLGLGRTGIWAFSGDEVAHLLQSFDRGGMAALDVKQIREAYGIQCVKTQEGLGAPRETVSFLLLRFATQEQAERTSKSEAIGKFDFYLQKGPILALIQKQGDVQREADALGAKLRARMGMK